MTLLSNLKLSCEKKQQGIEYLNNCMKDKEARLDKYKKDFCPHKWTESRREFSDFARLASH